MKRVRVFLWAAVPLALGGFAYLSLQQPARVAAPASRLLPGAAMAEGASWTLVDEAGRPFTPASLRGRPSIVMFGFTHCPDVCPTGLSYITSVLQALGEQADRIQPLFITVDPDRDTRAVMAEYTAHFDPRIVGVTGEAEQVGAALKSLGAYWKKGPMEDGAYIVDHTATMLLLNAEGHLEATLDIHEDVSVAVQKARRVIAAPADAKS